MTNSASRMPDAHDGVLQGHLRSLEASSDGVSFARVEDVLREVQSLERQQHTKSRFRRFARCLEPLVDFLVMYSPAVDMIVQYDVNPSAVVWGSLKTLIKIAQNSVKYFSFIERMLAKLADMLSISAGYEKMFEQELRVRTALSGLYLEVLLFLQRIRATISTSSFKILVKSIFRSVDVEFQDNIQRISRLTKLFEDEVTLAHRQHVEDHLKQQRFASSTVDQRMVSTEQTFLRQSEGDCWEERETRRSIMIWLGEIDGSEALRRAAKKRSPDTGLWLFNEPLFTTWIQNSGTCPRSRMLWVHGAPGAGKTVLSSTTIDYVRARQTARDSHVTYFFGDAADKSKGTAFNICISALSQLLAQSSDMPNALLVGYRNSTCHGRCRISEADQVFDLFREVVATLSSVSLIIDALDECNCVSDITSWLSDVTRSLPSFRVIYFSRDMAAVRKELAQQPYIRMDAASTKQDVDNFLASAVGTLSCPEVALKDRVFRTLSRKAEGMFLFADLSMQTLRAAIDVDDIENILHTIPDGINEMYGLILRRLNTESLTRRSLVQRVFRLICASMRPLTWSEMRFALSWDPDQTRFQKNKEPFRETISELCCPLIEYQIENDTFRLVHFSLYEYLCDNSVRPLSENDITQFFIQQSDAQYELAVMTLACIADVKVSRAVHLDSSCHPLLAYATTNWCHHLSQSPLCEDLRARYLDFVGCPERRSTWILRWLLSEEWSFPLQTVVKLQKLAQQWVNQGTKEQPSMVDILGDIQRALFRLDAIQPATQSSNSTVKLRAISNTERLTCVRDLAREYTMAGALDNGVEMFELALRREQEVGGGVTLRSCWLLNSLGILYDQQGRTSLAKETQSKALAFQEQSLPPNHLDIVLTVNELGRIARHLEQFGEAESLHRKALGVLEELLPESDFNVTWTKSALGRALLKQNRPDEALALHRQVLAIETARLGSDHPHTIWTLSDVARCHCAQGLIDDAIEAQREVMERGARALGPQSPDTLWATNSLAILYERSGRRDTAARLHARALAGQAKILGEDHAHTRWSREALSRLER